MTRRSRRVFLLLTLALLIGDAVMVGFSYHNAQKLIQQSLEEQGEKLHAAYEVAYAATLSNMLQLATFIASDPVLQHHFLQGKLAVEYEGGGPGGEEAARHRRALLAEVGPAWKQMTDRFDARQLHFHLGPGSTSFLRVHRPDKFGDNMDTVRHTVVDTNRDKTPRTGFETGRVYSGLRGVVPMWTRHRDETVYIGALEVGTSFNEMFRVLDNQLDAGIATLLKMPHIRDNMWSHAIDTQYARIYRECDCAIEARSRPGLETVLEHYADQGLSESPFGRFGSEHIFVGGRHLAVTHWPLHDYYGITRQTAEPVGAVLIWRDISGDIEALNNSLRDNILIAVLSFAVLELLLFWSVRLVTRQLESTITERTAELDRANERLEELAQTDELTGLNNRRHFMSQLEQEVERAQRHNLPLVLAMADLDHFKQVNDRFGHITGDHALQAVSACLRTACRSYDILGRYGGEELMVILPQTALLTAQPVLERLRTQVEKLNIESNDGRPVALTISIGVASLQPGQSAAELIDVADKLLYEAKAQGRNRLSVQQTATQ